MFYPWQVQFGVYEYGSGGGGGECGRKSPQKQMPHLGVRYLSLKTRREVYDTCRRVPAAATYLSYMTLYLYYLDTPP